MSESRMPMARLYGGPADQVRMPPPEGTQEWENPWPGYLCINLKQGMPAHYVLISSGIYEHAGACAEFDHDPAVHVQRCPDCGAKILGKHPEHGR